MRAYRPHEVYYPGERGAVAFPELPRWWWQRWWRRLLCVHRPAEIHPRRGHIWWPVDMDWRCSRCGCWR